MIIKPNEMTKISNMEYIRIKTCAKVKLKKLKKQIKKRNKEFFIFYFYNMI